MMPLPLFKNLLTAGAAENILPHLKKILAENLENINALLDETPTPRWEDLIPLLQETDNRLQRYWSPVAHLHAVCSTPELRLAYQACLPELTAYSAAIGQHAGLYQAFLALKNAPTFGARPPAEQRLVELKLRDFHLSGVDLPEEKQARYREIETSLATLGAKFSEHVLDATHAQSFLIQDKKELAGLPASILKQYETGSDEWRLTLDYPCYSAILKYADHRALREKLYTAYVTRASELSTPAFDNSSIITDILTLRQELADILGYKNYAELSLATKMAENPETVVTFLRELAKQAKPAAERELAELTEFAGHALEPWDMAYYAEKLKAARYHFDEETLRPYFMIDQVVAGLFELAEILFDIKISEAHMNPAVADIWNKEVKLYEIFAKKTGDMIGKFYLDLYVRPEKREGAWMDDYCGRFVKPSGEIQHPVAYLTCNFTHPAEHQPGLLTHDEVITLFHEFGHGLQHLLTRVNYLDLSGIHQVSWDAVEFPSQFMENWCWEPDMLKKLSRHHETGETLPQHFIQSLLAAKNFHSGLQLVRQLEFALFDINLHKENSIKNIHEVADLLKQTRAEIAVAPVAEFNRFQHTFSHIFDGGYAAGYYSYLWAEALAADAFALFAQQGIFNQELGARFAKTVLGLGGSVEPMKVFRLFQGRELDPKALLKSWGLLP